MGLGKQAKTLSKGQVEAVLGYLAKTRWPARNRLIFLLSVKAGLRAKEIASLTWRMVIDAQGQIGQAIHLENRASKGKSGRVIPMNEELRTAFVEYKCDDLYSPKDEIVVRWDDPAIGIAWGTENPLLSARDAAAQLLSQITNLPVYGQV
jgi:integrase